MSKRVADKYLTDQNWEEEEEPQEAGVFKPADEETLKTRVMKKAKRRNLETSSQGKGVFLGFGGLKPTSSEQKEISSLFKLEDTSKPSSLSDKLQALSKKKGATIYDLSKDIVYNDKPEATAKNDKDGSFNKNETDLKDKNQDAINKDYNLHLSTLNKCVSRWIMEHVDRNPLCDLTPVFKDYEKHLIEMDKKFSASSDSDTSSSKNIDDISKESTEKEETLKLPEKPLFYSSTIQDTDIKSLFGAPFGAESKAKLMNSGAPRQPLFPPFSSSSSPFKGFGPSSQDGAEQTVKSSPFQGFGNTSDPTKSKGFGNSSNPFTTGFRFGTTNQSVTTDDAKEKSDEDYVPPAPDNKIVQEKDAFYSKKCQLFYLSDGKYKEKGTGQIHLKTTPSNKTQFIIRADTSLGNIFLNIILSKTMQASVKGKSNVSLFCIPNPPFDEENPQKPVMLLMKIKTIEEAKELVQIINEKKGE